MGSKIKLCQYQNIERKVYHLDSGERDVTYVEQAKQTNSEEIFVVELEKRKR